MDFKQGKWGLELASQSVRLQEQAITDALTDESLINCGASGGFTRAQTWWTMGCSPA